MVRKIVLIVGILVISLILFSGCIQQSPASTGQFTLNQEGQELIEQIFSTYSQQEYSTETIVVSGVDSTRTVNPAKSTKLIVSGVRNNVTILNCNVEQIIASGVDNTIYYPSDCNPKIIESGVRNTILATS